MPPAPPLWTLTGQPRIPPASRPRPGGLRADSMSSASHRGTVCRTSASIWLGSRSRDGSTESAPRGFSPNSGRDSVPASQSSRRRGRGACHVEPFSSSGVGGERGGAAPGRHSGPRSERQRRLRTTRSSMHPAHGLQRRSQSGHAPGQVWLGSHAHVPGRHVIPRAVGREAAASCFPPATACFSSGVEKSEAEADDPEADATNAKSRTSGASFWTRLPIGSSIAGDTDRRYPFARPSR